MPMPNERWRDSYDAWKTRLPDDNDPICERCGEGLRRTAGIWHCERCEEDDNCREPTER